MVDFREIARDMDSHWRDSEPVPPPEPWQRGWGTSWLRTLVGVVVVSLVMWLFTTYLPLDHARVIEKGPYAGIDFDGAVEMFTGMMGGYVLWVGTWLDHVMARFGSLSTFLAVTGGALALQSIGGAEHVFLGAWTLVMVVVAFTVAYCCENAIVPNSFEGMKRSFRPF